MHSIQPSPIELPAELTAELLARARGGDDAAFAELFEQHAPELRRRVEGSTIDPARESCAPDDLILETYLVALRRLEEFESRREGAFGRWLAHIANLRVAEALRPPARPPTARPCPAEPEVPPPPAAAPAPAAVESPAGSETRDDSTADEPASLVPPAEPELSSAVVPSEDPPHVALRVLDTAQTAPVAGNEEAEPEDTGAVLEPEPETGDAVLIVERHDDVALAPDAVRAEESTPETADPGPTASQPETGVLPEVPEAPEMAAEVTTGPPTIGNLLPPDDPTDEELRDGDEPGAGEEPPGVEPPVEEDLAAADAGPRVDTEEPTPDTADPAPTAAQPEAGVLPAAPEMAADVTTGASTIGNLLPPDDLTELIEELPEGGADEELPGVEPPVEENLAAADTEPRVDLDETPIEAPVDAVPLSEDLSGLMDVIEELESETDREPQTAVPAAAGPLAKPERRPMGRLAKIALAATVLAAVAGGLGVERHLRQQRDEVNETARRLEREQARRVSAEAELERERSARAEETTVLARERARERAREHRERLEREDALERERMDRRSLEGRRESELATSRSALRAARALGLANASRHVAAENSMLSLVLAREAVADAVTPELYGPLHGAIRGSLARWVRKSSGMEPTSDGGAPARFEGAAFSASGEHVLAWSSGTNLVTVWDLAGNERALVRTGEDRIWTVDCSPTSDTFAIALGDGVTGDGLGVGAGGRGSVSVRDMAGRELARLEGHTDDVLSAVYAPGGDRILTVSADGSARLWDAEGKVLASLPVATDARGGSAVFSPIGDRLLTAGSDGKIAVWTRDGEPVTEFDAPGPLESARFTPAGDRVLAIAESGAEAQLLSLKGDLLTIFPSRSVRVGVHGPYRNLYADLSPSGDRLLTASHDGIARLWKLDGEEWRALEGHAATYLRVAFSPRGDRIVTASADGTARLWDAQGRALAVLDQHEGAVTAAAFSPSGDYVLTVDTGGLAILSETADGDVPVLAGSDGEPTRICVTSDRIVTASTDHDACVWDLRGRLRAILAGHRDAVRSVECSPAGDFVLTRSDDGTARLWHKDGDALATFRARERDVWSATFSRDGKRVLLGCGDGKARLCAQLGDVVAVFDPAAVEGTGGPERVTRARDRAIWSATFSSDGSEVFTASGTGEVHVWDLRGGHLRKLGALGVELRHARGNDHLLAWDRGARAWRLHGADGSLLRADVGANSARFSASGDAILGAGGTDARLLPARGGDFDASEFPVFAHDSAVLAAVFSPSEDRIATGCADGTARVWSRDGTLLAVLRGHEGPVVDMRFTPDGKRLVTASRDGTARVWLTDEPDLRALATRRALRDLTTTERRRFAGLLSDDE